MTNLHFFPFFFFQCGLIVLPPMVNGGAGSKGPSRPSSRCLKSLARHKSSLYRGDKDCHVYFSRLQPLPAAALDTTFWRPLWPVAASKKTAADSHSPQHNQRRRRQLLGLRRERIRKHRGRHCQRPAASSSKATATRSLSDDDNSSLRSCWLEGLQQPLPQPEAASHPLTDWPQRAQPLGVTAAACLGGGGRRHSLHLVVGGVRHKVRRKLFCFYM